MNGFHRRHRIDTLDKLAKDSAVAALSTATTPAANSVPGGQNIFQSGQPPPFPCTAPGHLQAGVNGYIPQPDLNGFFPQVNLKDPHMGMGFQGFQGQDAPQPQVPVPAQQQQMDFGFDLDFQH